VFQSRTKFWREEKVSLKIEFGQPSLAQVWSIADDVGTQLGLIVGTAQGGMRAPRPQ
jgi:monoamine oxidase